MANHKTSKKTYSFRAIIEPDVPAGYHGYVPALPGCHTCGSTIEETQRNLKEAILGILETMLAHKLAIARVWSTPSLGK